MAITAEDVRVVHVVIDSWGMPSPPDRPEVEAQLDHMSGNDLVNYYWRLMTHIMTEVDSGSYPSAVNDPTCSFVWPSLRRKVQDT